MSGKSGRCRKPVAQMNTSAASVLPRAVSICQPPSAEPRRDDLLVEADEFGEAAVAGDLFDVGQDLGRRRIFARPVVVGLERKLVLARQNIDKEAGKGVVPPGPADFAGLFVDREIDARAFQRLGHEQPRHAGAGDDNPKSPLSHRARSTLPDLHGRSVSRPPPPRQPMWEAGGEKPAYALSPVSAKA